MIFSGKSRVGVLACVAVVAACSSLTDPRPMDAPGVAVFAKPGSEATPVVSSVTPAYGEQGETNKLVTISGSGFAAGALVAWERGGFIDPAVTVHSATVKSASRIDAVISIAGDADAVLYDVSVTNVYANSRKKGIGTELFEVRITGQIVNPTAIWEFFATTSGGTPAGITGDGRAANGVGAVDASGGSTGAYQTETCGASGFIFLNKEGDATIDPDFDWKRGIKCDRRVFNFASGIGPRAPHVNARGVGFMAPGEVQQRVMRWSIGVSGCEVLEYHGDNAAVITRTPDDAQGRRTWLVESQGAHTAQCSEYVNGQYVLKSGFHVLPFSVRITEMR